MVEQIVRQWREKAPGLDTSPLEVSARILRLARQFEDRRSDVLREHGLGLADFDVLATLRRAAGRSGMTPSQLIRSVMLTSGGITKGLDRLERAGLLERAPDARDRRSIRVVLTPEGRRVVDSVLPEILRAESSLLEGLSERDRQRFIRLLGALLATAESET
jgi:DNA-binding MarR family transcriptional regulator